MKGNFSMQGFELKEAREINGKPMAIRVGIGPEFLSRVFINFCEAEDLK